MVKVTAAAPARASPLRPRRLGVLVRVVAFCACVLLLTCLPAALRAGETPAPIPRGETVQSREARVNPVSSLGDELRAELISRSLQYAGEYAGTGDRTSTFTIHWPTVLIIIGLIILL